MPSPEAQIDIILPEQISPEYTPPFTPSQERFLTTIDDATSKLGHIMQLDEIKSYVEDTLINLRDLPEKKQREHLPEIFALAGKAIELSTGMKPRNTQYVTAFALVNGNIAELPSGEGKTLATGIATMYQALTNESVHVVTANDYLARRDLSELGRAYEAFGLKSGVIFGEGQDVMRFDDTTPGEDPENFPHLQRVVFNSKNDKRHVAHREVYSECNIIYSTVKNLIFDEQIDTRTPYINDQRRTRINENGKLVPIKKAVLIADEVDQLAIDDALTPHILSDIQELTNRQVDQIMMADHVARKLAPPIYVPDPQRKGKFILESGDYDVNDIDSPQPWVSIRDSGWDKILSGYRLNSKEFLAEGTPYYQLIRNALLAHAVIADDKEDGTTTHQLFQKDREYIITLDEEAIPARYRIDLIDKSTGRARPQTILSNGLHQALEAKEGFVYIHGMSRTFASTTIQSFLRSYAHFSGTTGTAQQSEKLFQRFYDRNIEVIPPFYRPELTRISTELLSTPNKTFDIIKILLLYKIQKATNEIGDIDMQPFLLAAGSEAEAEQLYALFMQDDTIQQLVNDKRIDLRPLTAKNLTEEANFIALAGKKNTITISTAIAGRGTHIELGGKRPTDTNGKILSEDTKKYQDWKEDHDKVEALGGLFVIAASVPPTQRELEQLARRAGRKGELGEFVIIASLDGPSFVTYGVDKAIRLIIRADGNVGQELFAPMIATVQQTRESNYSDQLESLVHIDRVYNSSLQLFQTTQREIFQNTAAWLEAVPDILATAAHECFASHPSPDDLNKALTITDTIGDIPYEIPLATVEEINNYLDALSQKENTPFFPLEKMSISEQEHAVRQYLLGKLQHFKANFDPDLQRVVVQHSAERYFTDFWEHHLEEVDEMLAQANFERVLPYATFAIQANRQLKQHLHTLELTTIATLLSA